MVEAIFEKKNLAFLFVRLVSAVGQLVAPLLHPDTLADVAGELTLLLAPSQLHLKSDLVTRATWTRTVQWCFPRDQAVTSIGASLKIQLVSQTKSNHDDGFLDPVVTISEYIAGV